MTRIAVISYHTCPLSDEKKPDVGGMNTYVLELSKALAEMGNIIDIYTRCAGPDNVGVVQVLPNLRVIHLPAGKPIEIAKKKLYQYIPGFTGNLNKFIQKEKLTYDLISSHYYLSGLIGLSLKRKLKIPLLVTFHTLSLMKNLVAKTAMEKEDILRIKSEMLLVKKADKIIATGKRDYEYIQTLYNCPKDKIALLAPGVDLKLFKPIEKTAAKKIIQANLNHKIILFVGRIEPLKGIDVLLYAIKILAQKDPNLLFCLWIVGTGDIKYLKEIVKMLGITSYVKFVGKKRPEELPYYYNCAEIAVMPSQYESFGIVALEAMACAVPVIVSDAAGVSGLLDKEHSYLLTSANNPIILAEKISNLLNNKSKHKAMSEEVFKKVQNLGWNRVADKFNKILDDLTKKK